MSRFVLALLLLLPCLAPAQVSQISARSLKAHVGFLASDTLEGRDTPSAGLEASAEYIAAQFERIGLQPVNGVYFQRVTFLAGKPEPKKLKATLLTPNGPQEFASDQLEIRTTTAVNLENRPMFKVEISDLQTVESLTPEQVDGGVIIYDSERRADQPAAEGQERAAQARKLSPQLTRLKPAAVVVLDPRPRRGQRNQNVVIDPEEPSRGPAVTMTLRSEDYLKSFETLPNGLLKDRITIQCDAPDLTEIHPRNIAGLIPGSDPALKDTYVLVTAHYDHVGRNGFGPVPGDDIWNGANDNASGTAALIETASALVSMKPKRSILFVSVVGEEKGLLGSRWYARHPLEPLKETVAQINLEQLGRSDGDGGKGAVYLIGYEYTDMPPVFAAAAEANGMELKRHGQDGDQYWLRSDHASLANKGIPATTIMTTFTFPDYHRPGDSADKLDYEQFQAATRTAAQAILTFANNPAKPKWNTENPKTAPFIEAASQLQ